MDVFDRVTGFVGNVFKRYSPIDVILTAALTLGAPAHEAEAVVPLKPERPFYSVNKDAESSESVETVIAAPAVHLSKTPEQEVISDVLDRTSGFNGKVHTRDSLTGLVYKFTMPTRKGDFLMWAKIGDEEMLEREEIYMQQCWTHPELQTIITRFYDSFDVDELRVLVLHDAHDNQRLVPIAVQQEHYKQSDSLIEQFTKPYNLDQLKFRKEDTAIDVLKTLKDIFNVSLEHSIMLEHLWEDAYDKKLFPSIHLLQTLHERLEGVEADQIMDLFDLYSIAAARAKDYDLIPTVLGNYDRAPHNQFQKGRGARVGGDYGLVARGTPEFTLGAMGIENVPLQVEAYTFFRNELDGSLYAEDLVGKTTDIAYTKAVRLACFFAQKGRIEEMNDCIARARYFGNLLS